MTRRALLLAALVLAGCGQRGPGERESSSFPVTIAGAFVREPVLGDVAAGYLTMWRSDGENDALVSISSPDAGRVMLHGAGMATLDSLPLTPGDTTRLEVGGAHLMLENLTRVLAPGDTVTLNFTFSRAGPIVVRAPVVALSEADI